MTATPTRLYRREDLYDAWDRDNPRSWADSFDGRTYLDAVRAGLRAPEDSDVAVDRALHDTAMTRLIHDRLWADGCRPAAIMGGHKAPRGSATYRAAAAVAAEMARRGLTVLTGGGPGAMEAAHLGARLGPTSIVVDDAVDDVSSDPDQREFPLGSTDLMRNEDFDPDALARLHEWQIPAVELAVATDHLACDTVGVPTWHYGHEPPTPLATHHAKYFENSVREDGLLALAVSGIVYLPGSAGTLQEVFQDAAQNHYRTVRGIFSPMVFLDIDAHWSETFPIRPVIEALLSPDDLDLVCWTADVDEAVEFIDAFVLPAAADVV